MSGLDALQDPSQWCLPDPKKVVEVLQERSTPGTKARSRRWSFTARISPLRLYCYLKARFGEPNGFAMTLRSPTVDNLIHWHYTLQCHEVVFDIHGLDTRTTITAHAEEASDEEWSRLERGLVEEFTAAETEIKSVQRSLERWKLFVNPYRRLLDGVLGHTRRLDELEPQVRSVTSASLGPVGTAEFRVGLLKAQHVCSEVASICSSLRMMAPVLGESAVNLLLCLLGKPEIRRDQHLRESASREKIDLRVRKLHLHCDGMGAVTGSEEAFKSFHRLMQGRNELLHGSVPLPTKSSRNETVYFDQSNIPLVEDQRSFEEMALRTSLDDLGIEDARADISVAKQFVDFLLAKVRPEVRRSVELAFNQTHLGFHAEDRRLRVILPTVRTDVIL